MTTVVPLSATVSAIGFCAITVFSATAPLSSKTTSTRKPALSKVFFASVWVAPTTLGTGTLPLETVMLTKVPMSTEVLAGGSCSITVPSGLSLSSGVTFPSTRRASVSASLASSLDVRPTKSGTPVWSLPAETIKLTA